MGYLSEKDLQDLGFKSIGVNVKISDKASIYNPEKMLIGDFARIDDFCVISGKITLGRNVHIACLCNLAGGTEGIWIEDFGNVAYGCHILTQSDDFTGDYMVNPTIPEKYTNVCRKSVQIEKHSVIGTKSVIFPGVTLREGTSIGAMSLVTKSTTKWSINIGIPAKKIKNRKQNLLELEKEYLANEGKI